MGVVYRARDPRLDRQVAIKLLPPGMAGDPEARARLRFEAMAAAALDHPYICKIFEIGEQEGRKRVIAIIAGMLVVKQFREEELRQNGISLTLTE
ncbi:MAG: hypothetical protein WB919_04760 [Candidatus Sulfotelmatobacter sp.]